MFFAIVLTVIFVGIIWLLLNSRLPKRKRKNTIAIFHLYCSSGGGGERVLWHLVEALFKQYPNYTIYIYSHKNVQEDTLGILVKVRDLFKIDLLSNKRIIDKLEFVPLRFSWLIEAKRYPFLTLLFQNIGSVLLSLEAAYRLMPEVYMETIGFTFTIPVFKLHKCTVITYVHYPIISDDMIRNVRTTTHASFNNREIFVRFPPLRNLKIVYYRILAYLYGVAGRQADLVMVNSTWTQNHIKSLWNTETKVVYPPCDVESFKSVLSSRESPKTTTSSKYQPLNIISIAQFRPEKDHELQIMAFDHFLHKSKAYNSKLTLYGGCRDIEDRKRVEILRELIGRLELESNIDIVVGASFERLLEGVKEANVAIHTMRNEHFGIVLLECMAAGLIVVAHNSGGPKTDIIDHGMNGYLAEDLTEFSDHLLTISSMDSKHRKDVSLAATKKSDHFSTRMFEDKFIELACQFLRK